jgi:hypothetical protein
MYRIDRMGKGGAVLFQPILCILSIHVRNFGDASASLDLALRVAEYFEVKSNEARQVVREVGQAVASWRKVAARIGIAPKEIERMASAFEHSDLAAAIRV